MAKNRDLGKALQALGIIGQTISGIQQIKEAQKRQKLEDEAVALKLAGLKRAERMAQVGESDMSGAAGLLKQYAMTKHGKPTGLAGAVAGGHAEPPTASGREYLYKMAGRPVPTTVSAKAEVEGLKAQGFTDADVKAMKSKKVGTGVYMMEVLNDPYATEESKTFARLYLSKPSQEQWELKKKIFQNPTGYSDDQKRTLGIHVVQGKSITTGQIDQVWEDFITLYDQSQGQGEWRNLPVNRLTEELNAFGRQRLPELWVDYNVYETTQERKNWFDKKITTFKSPIDEELEKEYKIK